MAAIPVTFIGTLTYSDLAVGGGPMPGGPPPQIWPSPGVPTHPIAPGGSPPEIWPSPGYPAHPIAPGGQPPSIWPSPGTPAHPIVLPPEQPPSKPPEGGSDGGSWNYSPSIGWYWTSPGGRWVYVSGDKPSPPQIPTEPGTPAKK